MRDAEALFRSKPIAEIRSVEAATRSQIQQKQEELRVLVGTRYRDLIDSADSILRMKASAQSISSNISSIQRAIASSAGDGDHAISAAAAASASVASRARIYGVACRVKYLVDTPENIWACLDESMFLEAATRYVRSSHVHACLEDQQQQNSDVLLHRRFALLQHQWQIVDALKAQISQRARDRLFDRNLPVRSYADALAALAVTDDLSPSRLLALFLESRRVWLSQTLVACSSVADLDSVVSVFREVLRVIQVTVGQVGELFLRVLNDMPLFYKVVLDSPPASQLFGGIPNPESEVKLWTDFRDKLESTMVMLDRDYIARTCSSWLKECGREAVGEIDGRFLIDAVVSGQDLASAEKLIREMMEGKEVLEGSIEWLKSVFGSDIELPWSRMRELVLGDDSDLWDEIFEDAFVSRMKVIVDMRFGEMTRAVKEEGKASGERVGTAAGARGSGVWFVGSTPSKLSGVQKANSAGDDDFKSCLDAYLGQKISGIRDAVDGCCQSVLDDVLSFLESPKASVRLKALAPYLQTKCYDNLSSILNELKDELCNLESAMKPGKDKDTPVIVERALFIGRLLFAFLNHSRHVPVLLGPPRFWVNETMSAVFDRLPLLMRQSKAAGDSPVALNSPRRNSPRQNPPAMSALLGAEESASPKLEEFISTLRELCIRAHGLWISWLSDELSAVLALDLGQDDALSSTSPMRGWEETIVKQDESEDNHSEMKILLPSMPSLYVVSFLLRACEEIHRIGGHVLDRTILQKFALSLLEKVIGIYGNFISTRVTSESQVSEKGVLQILLDLRFIVDVLSGGDSVLTEDASKVSARKSPFRRKHDQKNQNKSIVRENVDGLITRLSQRLDPIDWLTYEPYLWENERQSYQRHAVIFGFFVQLNRMYTDTLQKLSTNSESNIMRCSSVPRFKYLPISAPALSSRGTAKASISLSAEDISSRNSWKAYTNADLSENIDMDDTSTFGVATPFLKSFMQVGSKFGGSTLSTAAMSTFGDILPAQAAGLLSSFTASKSDS